MNIKKIVKDNTAEFYKYRQGVAYYRVDVPEHGPHMFPIPLAELGEATLVHREKAITLMRYIRLAMKEGSLVPLSG